MKRYSLTYFISQSLKSLWRNGFMSLASIAVLMSCLVVIGSFSLLVYNLNVNLDRLNLLNEIVVFTEFDATEEEINSVAEAINSLDNIVKVKHITKAEALEDMKKRSKEFEDLFDDITEENNPLSDSFVITYSNKADVSTLSYALRNHIAGVRKVSNRSDLAGMMAKLKNAVMLIFMWFLIVLVVVSVIVIINTIKIGVFARRNEITVMRYVGATNWFITLPFVFEGVFIGLFSGTVAFFLEWYVYRYVETMVSGDFAQIVDIVPFSEVKGVLLCGFLCIGIVTGIIGSVISLRKYITA